MTAGDTPAKSYRNSVVWGLVTLIAVVALITMILINQEAQRPEQGFSVPSEGDRAPNFALKAADGSTVSLSDFAKKDVLLYFSMGPG
jgi:hypothetical protein